MRKNKLFLIIMIMALLSVGLACAFTTTIKSPTADSTPGATVSFQVNTTDAGKLENCSMSIASSATANASVAIFTEQLNDSSNIDFVNTSYTGTDLEDGLYTASATCWNNSSSASATPVNFYVDNTLPTAPTSLTSIKQTINSFTLSSTVVGSATTLCTMAFVGNSPLSGAVPSGVHSGNTCTFAITDASEGNYAYTVTASDSTNSSTSSSARFDIKINDNKASGKVTAIVVAKATVKQKLAGVGDSITSFFGSIKMFFVNLFS